MKTIAILILSAVFVVSASAQPEKTVNAFAQLSQVTNGPSVLVNNVIALEGLANPSDGLGGLFNVDPNSSASPDGTNIFAMAQGGRLLRRWPSAGAGGGSGDTIWTNYNAPDVEGGTVYGSYLLNPLTNKVINVAVNNLTNFWGDLSSVTAVGYHTADPAVIASTENAAITLNGDYAASSAQFTNSNSISINGDYAAQSAQFANAFGISLDGFFSAKGAQFTNSSSISINGFNAAKGAQFANSSSISLDGYNAASSAQFTNSSSISINGFNAASSAQFTNSYGISLDGYFSANGAQIQNTKGFTALGYNSAQSINGSYTNVVLIGAGSTIGPTGQDQVILGPAMTLEAPAGFLSRSTDAPIAISSTGWTNSFGKQAVVTLTATGATWVKYNNAGTAVATNATVFTGDSEIILQPAGAFSVTAGSVSGVANPF